MQVRSYQQLCAAFSVAVPARSVVPGEQCHKYGKDTHRALGGNELPFCNTIALALSQNDSPACTSEERTAVVLLVVGVMNADYALAPDHRGLSGRFVERRQARGRHRPRHLATAWRRGTAISEDVSPCDLSYTLYITRAPLGQGALSVDCASHRRRLQDNRLPRKPAATNHTPYLVHSAAVRLATLPKSHPLRPLVLRAMRRACTALCCIKSFAFLLAATLNAQGLITLDD